MANKPFVSQDGYSIGDTPVNIILANGDITTTRITLSNDATSTSGAVVLTGDPNPISGNVGVLQIGPPLGFDDTDIVVSMSHSANGYTQVILQNPDPGTVASADFVVNNDRSTGAGIYGDFGINSSNYAGAGAFGIADGVYLLASNATMSVGTLTEHPLNLATNNVTRMTVASISGNITVTGNLAVGNLDMTAKANLGAVGNVAITGGSANYTLETNGSGVLSWVAPVTASSLSGTTLNSSIVTSSLTTVGTLGSLTVTGNISSGNANLGNLATANFFQGDGGLLSNITATGGTSIVNGTSNVVVVASGNVTTSVAGTANVLLVKTTGADISGNLTVSGRADVKNLWFTNPGVGNATTVTFDKTNDSAGFQVTEWSADNTLYDFYMGDNAFDGGDYFSWRMIQWTSENHVWQPFYLGAATSRYVASEHDYYGKITQTAAAVFSTRNLGGTGADAGIQVFGDVTKLKTVSSSALTITVLNVAGFTGTYGQGAWIEITGAGTTFDWGYGSATTGRTPVQTGLTVSTSPVTLNNGVLVTFSGTTGAALDQFAFALWPTPNNTFGNTAITGNLSATTTISATGNVSGGNLTTGGVVAATGNVTGGNLTTGGLVLATGNVTGGNLTTGGALAVTGNANVGNLGTGGLIVATGNVTGGNLTTGGVLAVTGNANIGNIGTAGLVVATGNITGGNLVTGGVLSVTGNANVGNLGVGNITADNLSGANLVSANYFTGTLTTAAQPNITSVGSLTSLTVVNDFSGNTGNFSGAAYSNASIVSAHQLTTKEYVDQAASTGLQIHTPVIVEFESAITGTYTQGGTTPTVITIATGNVLTTSATHSLSVNDIIVFGSSTNGLVAGTVYFVLATPAANQLTLTLAYDGTSEVTGLTNGTGLTISSRANSGVGSKITNAGTQTALVIDTVTMAVTNRVLVVNQANATWHGVYTVTDIGSGSTNWELTRATDADKYAPMSTVDLAAGSYFFITGGAAAGESYVLTAPAGSIIFGTTNITLTLFTASVQYIVNSPLDLTGQTLSIPNLTGSGSTVVLNNSPVLITPNLGNAMFESLTLSANSGAGNISGLNLSLTGSANVSNLNANGNVSFTGANVSLGSNANLKITGGSPSQYLQTDGAGNLSWQTVAAGVQAIIANGTSNVSIPAVNGNVNISSAGNANIVVVTGTGANVAGTLTTTGNVTGGNLLTAGSVTAETLVSNVAVGTAPFTVTSTTTVANLSVASATTAGTVTAASQGNITSVGTLSSLIVSGNANVGNLNATGQLVSTLAIGTAPLVVTSTTLVANLNVATAGVAGTVTANAQPNITSVGLLSTLTVGNATANTVFGNGTITTAGTGGNISGANVISANTVNVASQLISTVATSTAPLVVNSTTLVPNLYVAHANVAEMLNLTTGTTGNYYFTLASATTGNVAQVGNAAILANLTSGILYATKFSGDGGLLSNLSGGSSIVNGTSNVVVDSGANVRTSVAGNANIIVATGTGANVNGYLTVSGVTTLGAVANVKITGGTSGYVLRTDGAANLTWVAQGGGGGGVTLGAVVAQSLGMAMP